MNTAALPVQPAQADESPRQIRFADLGAQSLPFVPDTLFGRMLIIVLASVGVPHAIALVIAPQAHRSSLLGALFLLLPPVAFGVFCAARSITRPLARLADGMGALGRRDESPSATVHGPVELRNLSTAFDAAQNRVQHYLTNRARTLAAVSHDLKTPLTRMRLRVESLEDDRMREALVQDLDDLSGMVRSALTMLKDFDDPAAVESIDMNRLLTRLQADYAEMGQVVTIHGHARRPYMGHVQEIRRCLMNLIDNAIKFGGNVSVTLDDGRCLRLTVADQGPGIAPDELERVLEPYYRSRAALSRGVEGTGLGLCIARDIALSHGGRLTLRNGSSSGLEAEVLLPRY
jgi:signal transduction histidine kinase